MYISLNLARFLFTAANQLKGPIQPRQQRRCINCTQYTLATIGKIHTCFVTSFITITQSKQKCPDTLMIAAKTLPKLYTWCWRIWNLGRKQGKGNGDPDFIWRMQLCSRFWLFVESGAGDGYLLTYWSSSFPWCFFRKNLVRQNRPVRSHHLSLNLVCMLGKRVLHITQKYWQLCQWHQSVGETPTNNKVQACHLPTV